VVPIEAVTYSRKELWRRGDNSERGKKCLRLRGSEVPALKELQNPRPRWSFYSGTHTTLKNGTARQNAVGGEGWTDRWGGGRLQSQEISYGTAGPDVILPSFFRENVWKTLYRGRNLEKKKSASGKNRNGPSRGVGVLSAFWRKRKENRGNVSRPWVKNGGNRVGEALSRPSMRKCLRGPGKGCRF